MFRAKIVTERTISYVEDKSFFNDESQELDFALDCLCIAQTGNSSEFEWELLREDVENGLRLYETADKETWKIWLDDYAAIFASSEPKSRPFKEIIADTVKMLEIAVDRARTGDYIYIHWI